MSELAEWMENHNIPELLHQCLEKMKINRDYTALKGLETTGAATVKVTLKKLTSTVSRIDLNNVSVADVEATTEELEDAKKQLVEAEKTIKEQNKEIENLKKTQVPKTLEKPRKLTPKREKPSEDS